MTTNNTHGLQVTTSQDIERRHEVKRPNFTMRLTTLNGNIREFFCTYNQQTITFPITNAFPQILATASAAILDKLLADQDAGQSSSQGIPRRTSEKDQITWNS